MEGSGSGKTAHHRCPRCLAVCLLMCGKYIQIFACGPLPDSEVHFPDMLRNWNSPHFPPSPPINDYSAGNFLRVHILSIGKQTPWFTVTHLFLVHQVSGQSFLIIYIHKMSITLSDLSELLAYVHTGGQRLKWLAHWLLLLCCDCSPEGCTSRQAQHSTPKHKIDHHKWEIFKFQCTRRCYLVNAHWIYRPTSLQTNVTSRFPPSTTVFPEITQPKIY